MGARGPHKLRIVNGEAPGPGDEVTAADLVELGEPDKPEGMPDGEVELWNRLVPLLDQQGLVSPVDGLTIDLALRHYLAAVQASDELAQADSLAMVDEKNGRHQKHPADAVLRLHSAMFLQYARELGLTFASRARLQMRAVGDGGGEENPFSPAAGGS